MEFYKIESPTTKQIFDAIINKEYIPIEKLQSKAKQIKILLLDYYCASEILVTFSGVTNTGGIPIFLTSNDSLFDIASETPGFYELSEEDQNNDIELLGAYLRTYDDIFNL
jgi:hypothetical protein